MKALVILLTLMSLTFGCTKSGPYDESADARADIKQALSEAKITQKPVIVLFGANWCSDCRAVDEILSTGKVAQKITDTFKLVKVNVGNFDTNLDIANDYGNPISGGIPGAALLSANGKIVYITSPGELSSIKNNGAEVLYQLFKQRLR
ncbi:MAG: thioredoxin family protein [Methylophilaceae bacterium]